MRSGAGVLVEESTKPSTVVVEWSPPRDTGQVGGAIERAELRGGAAPPRSTAQPLCAPPAAILNLGILGWA